MQGVANLSCSAGGVLSMVLSLRASLQENVNQRSHAHRFGSRSLLRHRHRPHLLRRLLGQIHLFARWWSKENSSQVSLSSSNHTSNWQILRSYICRLCAPCLILRYISHLWFPMDVASTLPFQTIYRLFTGKMHYGDIFGFLNLLRLWRLRRVSEFFSRWIPS